MAKKKINKIIKKNKLNIIIYFLFFLFFLFIFIFLQNTNLRNRIVFKGKDTNTISKIFEEGQRKNLENNKIIFKEKYISLKKENCLKIKEEDNICNLNTDSYSDCFYKIKKTTINPVCFEYKTRKIKKPEHIKAVYYSAYAAASKEKIKELLYLAKNAGINAVVIDIKEIDGKLFLKIPTSGFKIKPEFLNIIKNPKKLLETLHKNNFYTIARIVSFKDKNLVKKHPEFAVKKSDKKTIWLDYKKKTWLDANNKKVWDYLAEISKQVYLLGFDEINLDYVRFPSDGPLKDIYYPYSNKEITKSKKWGRTKVMDSFYYYFTNKLKKQFPSIQISADVFGQVALSWGDSSIGQILESAVLYFDGVYPMSYPSHYAWNFIPEYNDGPDHHPYEVINKTVKSANRKIDILNKKIENTKKNNQFLKIRPTITSKILPENLKKIDKSKIRYWLQGFYCSWCKNSKPYTKKEIDLQVKALKDNGVFEYLFWNAASKYKKENYLPEWIN